MEAFIHPCLQQVFHFFIIQCGVCPLENCVLYADVGGPFQEGSHALPGLHHLYPDVLFPVEREGLLAETREEFIER